MASRRRRTTITPLGLLVLGTAAVTVAQTQQQQHHLRSTLLPVRGLTDGNWNARVEGLPDSRKGDPNVATATTSDPPRRVHQDRTAVEAITNRPWVVPVLPLYNGASVAMAAVTDGFPFCQWHARLDWNSTRQGLLDKEAMYFVQVLGPLDNDTVWRVTGDFVPAMYFSFQLYDTDNTQLAETSWTDHQITPLVGKNPFQELATPAQAGQFQLHFTRNGNHGLPNELAAPVSNFGILVLRLYKTVPSEPLPMDLAIVPPKLQQGKLSDPTSLHTEWPACGSHLRTAAPFQESWYAFMTDLMNGDQGLLEESCPMPLGTTGMSVFETSSSSQRSRDFLIARNNNSPYLFYCLDSGTLRSKGLSEHNVVIKIRGKLPSFPQGLYQGEPEPLVPNKHTYDVRYASFSTIHALPPASQYEGIDGQAILDTYTQRYGDAWDGHYSLTISTDPSAPQRCHLLDAKKDVFLGYRQLDGEGAKYPRMRTRVYNPIVVYRQLLGDPTRPTARAALDACQAVGRCNDTALLHSVMEEYYPVVEFFICHSDGRVETLSART